MKRHSILTTPLVLVLLVSFGPLPFSFSAENKTPPQATVAETPQDIRVRYAEVKLELARVELQLLTDANKKLLVISRPMLERKRANIRIAEELLRVARNAAENSDATQVHLIHAREEAQMAKRQYMRALELKDHDKVFNELEMKQFQLRAEAAQLRYEMWSDPSQTLSLIHHMHWQIERLSEEVLDLRKSMAGKNH